jgi:short-subunit dehydrogenase
VTRILLTGASSGIGAVTAYRLSMTTRATLLLSARPSAALNEVVRRTGGTALPADLSDPAACDDLAARAKDADVLVANAGVGWAGQAAGMPPQDVERLVAVNLAAPIRLANALLPGMYERGRGRLVFVTSIAGAVGVAGEAVYSATKAGLACFAEAVRYEAAPHGVRVSVVIPGVVQTPFFERRGRAYDRSRPRPIPPERVAAAIEDAIRTGRPEIVVPRWLTFPARLRGAAPGLFRTLASFSS